MGMYIDQIVIHQLLDKRDLKIEIQHDGNLHHCILTGPNGAGKTTLFNAIANSLDMMYRDTNYRFMDYRKNLELAKKHLEKAQLTHDTVAEQKQSGLIKHYQQNCQELWGTVELVGLDYPEVFRLVRAHQYVIAFFGAERLSHFIEVKSPVKPNLTQTVLRKSKTEEFIKFLVDLKFQQSMAKNEGCEKDVEEIGKWFEGFERILQQLFDDATLKLSFDYRHYVFYIEKSGVRFSLADLSDGYSSALDIVADIILKMQDGEHIVRSYETPGLVFIDEIETHLHLKLQRAILPLLTALFPKIQFVVTTHSPFVLNSVDNAVVYDLEKQETVDDLSDYSYDILAEGYFGVKTESGKLREKMDELKGLMGKDKRNRLEEEQMNSLINDFDKLPEIIAPEIKAQYYELMTTNGKREAVL